MSNVANKWDDKGMLPNATREDGALLWHCPNCLTPRSVTAKRDVPPTYDEYIWRCSKCGMAWTRQNFILACNSSAELKTYTGDEVALFREVAKASAAYRQAELVHAAAVTRREAYEGDTPDEVYDAQRAWRIAVDKLGKEVPA